MPKIYMDHAMLYMCIVYCVHVPVNSSHIALKLLPKYRVIPFVPVVVLSRQMWENVLAAYIGSWVYY